MKTENYFKISPMRRLPLLLVFLLVFETLVLGTMVQSLEAVEPEAQLYAKEITERDTAYKMKGQLLAEKIAAAVDQKEKQSLLVQQQLLMKLEELPDNPEKPSLDLRFSEQDLQKNHSWQDVEQYLERYISASREAKISAENLENTSKKIQTLFNQLIALADKDPDQKIPQLQHAFQIRKFDQLTKIDKQLQDGMEIAKKQFPTILEHIQISPEMFHKQEQILDQAKKNLQELEDEKILKTESNNILIQQQESQLAGYLGRELSDDERKEMHYEQLKLLKQQVQQLFSDDQILESRIGLLEQEQKTTWFYLLAKKPDFFKLSDVSGDIIKKINKLQKNTDNAHRLIYTYEKELSTLRGGNALIGPKAQELINTLDEKVRTVFTLLSGIDQRTEMLGDKGRLLNKAINLKQSALGSMVTKTREATDNIFERVMSVLKYPLISYSGMSLSLLLILQVVLLLIFGIIINRLYGYLVLRMGHKRNWSEQTVHLIQAFGKYPFILIVAMIILSVVGINTRSLALVAGALSVGIGFGMQTIVNNLVSGIILLFDKSIRPGDFICLGDNSTSAGFRGNVVQMNIRATVLRTNDNINIIIPNADLMASQVVNWTYSDEKIRFRIPFSVAYGTDIDKVKSILRKAILDLPVVLHHPEPQIWLANHADSALAFIAAIWVEGESARQPARIKDIILTTIYKTLQAHGIEIPFPQMDLRMRGTEEQQSMDFPAFTDAMRLKMFQETLPQ
ncbi:MAG: mechanosensitive ion channel [Desulfobulbaceae bacterium]|nr:mechanosensitive ion channel [Desulfobulbaceae bacterium]